MRFRSISLGYGPTPIVHGDKLIVNVGGKADGDEGGVCVAAFDKKTGKTLWEVKDKWGASYASPVVAKIQGKMCALVMAAGESKPSHGGLLTIDVETGKVYDRFPWRARKRESVLASSPLALDEQTVFISECYEIGGVLLKYDAERKSTPVWKQREFGMHFMMPVVQRWFHLWLCRAQPTGHRTQVCEPSNRRGGLDERLFLEKGWPNRRAVSWQYPASWRSLHRAGRGRDSG